MKSVHPTCRAFLSLLLAILLGFAVPSISPVLASPPQDQSGQADANRVGPCSHVPVDASSAIGIAKLCPPLGSSAGVAKGDFNGDGIADLAIGIPNKDVVVQTTSGPVTVANAGAVQIIYGTAASGLAAPGSGSLDSIILTESTPGTNHLFGSALASGDFDKDGISDLAVGIPNATATNTAGRGAVQVFKGFSGSGLKKAPVATFGASNFYVAPNASPSSSRGAYSLAWGDFNGDGAGDLAVASDYSLDGYLLTVHRAVTVLFGTAGTGLTTTGKLHFETSSDAIADSGIDPAQVILSGGDFDGDGKTDLVAAMPFETVDGLVGAGAVHVLYGTTAGPSDCFTVAVCHIQPQRWTQNSTNIPGVAGPLAVFGSAVAGGDFNGDTAEDLAIGAPGAAVGTSSGAGSVTVIHGGLGIGLQAPASGSTASLLLTESTVGQTVAANDGFGASLAANKFNSDSTADLAIGMPNKASARGVVAVIYGSSLSLSATAVRAPQILTSNSLGVAAHAGDRFGASLTAWNFGRSTQADLAIGAPFTPVGTILNAGAVYVVYGSTTGLAGTAQVWNENSAGLHNSAISGDNFGAAVY
jgi:hypothetical protein